MFVVKNKRLDVHSMTTSSTTAGSPPKQIVELLRNWKEQIALNIEVHERYAVRYRRAFIGINVGCAVLASLAALALFSSYGGIIDESSLNSLLLVAGIAAVVLVFANGLSGFMDFGGVSKDHQSSITPLDSLMRFIDIAETTWDPNVDDARTILNSIRTQFDEAVKSSAHVSKEDRINALSAEVIEPKLARGKSSLGLGSISGVINIATGDKHTGYSHGQREVGGIVTNVSNTIHDANTSSSTHGQDTTTEPPSRQHPRNDPTEQQHGQLTTVSRIRESLSLQNTESKNARRNENASVAEMLRYQLRRLTVNDDDTNDTIRDVNDIV